MTPNAKATAHQRVPVGRCGVALPVFPKNSQIFIIPRGIIPVNTVVIERSWVRIPPVAKKFFMSENLPIFPTVHGTIFTELQSHTLEKITHWNQQLP